MDAGAAEILLSIVGSGGVVSILWGWGNAAKKEYVDSLKGQIETLTRQALSSETRAIASDQARTLAEKQAGQLEMKYGHLKQQFQQLVEALNAAQVRVDPKAFARNTSLPPREASTGVWTVEGDRRASYFLEQQENERRRQRPLNPSADHRDDLDNILQPYLDSDKPPKR